MVLVATIVKLCGSSRSCLYVSTSSMTNASPDRWEQQQQQLLFTALNWSLPPPCLAFAHSDFNDMGVRVCVSVWLISVVYLDESVGEAFDRHGPRQVGLAHVGGTSALQLSLTSERNLRGWDSHNRIHNHRVGTTTPAHLLLCGKQSHGSVYHWHSKSNIKGRKQERKKTL